MDKKVVALFDIHYPFNIPLDGVFNFIGDFKPDEIILGGDISHWSMLREWVHDQRHIVSGEELKSHYGELNSRFVEPLQSLVGNDGALVILEGNHEYWLKLLIQQYPLHRGYVELENNLHLRKQDKIIEINIPYKASRHLYYLHGLYTNKYHSQATIIAFLKSIRYGHTHDIQEASLISRFNVKQSHTAQSCGCLCTKNPEYMRNKPNRWLHAFNYAWIDTKTGQFFDFTPVITAGKFYAEGKKYSS